MAELKFKKVRTLEDIKNDPRIDRVILDYDGRGKHLVECKDGYKFESERTIEIGNISECCYSVNSNLESTGFSCENEHKGGKRCDDVCADCVPRNR